MRAGPSKLAVPLWWVQHRVWSNILESSAAYVILSLYNMLGQRGTTSAKDTVTVDGVESILEVQAGNNKVRGMLAVDLLLSGEGRGTALSTLVDGDTNLVALE